MGTLEERAPGLRFPTWPLRQRCHRVEPCRNVAAGILEERVPGLRFPARPPWDIAVGTAEEAGPRLRLPSNQQKEHHGIYGKRISVKTR